MISDEEMKQTLTHYVINELKPLFDWDTIVHRRKRINDDIICFDCYFMKLYFNNDMKPITYDKQQIIDNKLYYDFNEDDYQGAKYLTYLAKII